MLRNVQKLWSAVTGGQAKEHTFSVSIISPAYNVEAYLDTFFKSLCEQTIGLCGLEIIVVDDGSTDETWSRLVEWRERFPDNLKVLRQDRRGIAAARNAGLEIASGAWVSFVDPDDFVAADYFEELVEVGATPVEGRRPDLVLGGLQTFTESDGQRHNRHPFRNQLPASRRTLQLGDPAWRLQVPVVGLLFRRAFIERHGLRFHGELWSHAEDLAFMAETVRRLPPEALIGSASGALYFHRQRRSSSAADERWLEPSVYAEQVVGGPMHALQLAAELPEPARDFIFRSVLYHLLMHVRRIINRPDRLAHLSSAAQRHYDELLRACFEQIPERIISSPGVPGMRDYFKVGFLAYYRGARLKTNKAFLSAYDAAKRLLEVRFYSPVANAPERLHADGRRVVPLYPKTRAHSLFGRPFLYERMIWVSADAGEKLEISVGNKFTRISLEGDTRPSNAVAMDEVLTSFLTPPASLPADTDDPVLALLDDPDVRDRFRDCWILADRDVIADDSAEHLYRYMRRDRPEVNTFFAIRRDSPDWLRLEKDGFRLLDYGSDEYKAALISAKHVVSSHTLGYMLKGFDNVLYGNLASYKVTFLQHGVIKDDLSMGLNRQAMDLFITSIPPEYESIAGGPTYRYSSKQVMMTGLPRHDRLIANRGKAQRLVLVQPTWRGGLAGALTGRGSEREINPHFHESEYARTWKAFLRSDRLRALAERFDFGVAFAPHPNVEPYLGGFEAPEWIEVRTQASGSMQDMFLRAAMMITDYSSVMFEIALLGRPIIYYQFDAETFFSGAHTYEQGYFSYERDGFGPVVSDLDHLLAQLENLASRDFEPPALYQARMDNTFRYRDTRNSERVFRAISSLDEPDIPDQERAAAELEFARRVLREGDMADARLAWQRIRKRRPMQSAEAELALAKIAIHERRYAVAGERLRAVAPDPRLEPGIAAVEARLAVGRRDWEAASAILEKLRASGQSAANEDLALGLEASIYRLTDRLDDALAVTGVEALGPEARLERARALTATGRAEEAANLLEPELDSLAADSVIELARAFRMTGRVADAARLLNQLGPTANSPERDAERAAIAAARGEWKSAAKLYTRAAQAPDPPEEVLVNLAMVLRKVGDAEAALKALRQTDVSDERPKVLHQRALALSANHEWGEAAEAWEHLIRKNPAVRPIVHLHLAEALLNISEHARAQEAISRFDELSQGDEFGDRLRARLARQFALQ